MLCPGNLPLALSLRVPKARAHQTRSLPLKRVARARKVGVLETMARRAGRARMAKRARRAKAREVKVRKREGGGLRQRGRRRWKVGGGRSRRGMHLTAR